MHIVSSDCIPQLETLGSRVFGFLDYLIEQRYLCTTHVNFPTEHFGTGPTFTGKSISLENDIDSRRTKIHASNACDPPLRYTSKQHP